MNRPARCRSALLTLALALSACYSTSDAVPAFFPDAGEVVAEDMNAPAAGAPAPATTDGQSPSTQPTMNEPNPVPGSNVDQDGDGYPLANDCNDRDPSVHPGAVDNDPCDGIAHDCTFVACDRPRGSDSVDLDGDGFDASIDCNDNDSSSYPNAPDDPCDYVDTNCDGYEPRCEPYDDRDRDGYDINLDCNDDDFFVHPNAYDGNSCDDLDENCDRQEAACNADEDAGVAQLIVTPR